MLHLSYSTLFAVTANLLDPAVLQFVIVINNIHGILCLPTCGECHGEDYNEER